MDHLRCFEVIAAAVGISFGLVQVKRCGWWPGGDGRVGVNFALSCCNFALTKHNLNIHCTTIPSNLEMFAA